MTTLIKIINDLVSSKFWGKIIISFENGKIMPVIKKEETLRLE